MTTDDELAIAWLSSIREEWLGVVAWDAMSAAESSAFTRLLFRGLIEAKALVRIVESDGKPVPTRWIVSGDFKAEGDRTARAMSRGAMHWTVSRFEECRLSKTGISLVDGLKHGRYGPDDLLHAIRHEVSGGAVREVAEADSATNAPRRATNIDRQDKGVGIVATASEEIDADAAATMKGCSKSTITRVAANGDIKANKRAGAWIIVNDATFKAWQPAEHQKRKPDNAKPEIVRPKPAVWFCTGCGEASTAKPVKCVKCGCGSFDN